MLGSVITSNLTWFNLVGCWQFIPSDVSTESISSKEHSIVGKQIFSVAPRCGLLWRDVSMVPGLPLLAGSCLLRCNITTHCGKITSSDDQMAGPDPKRKRPGGILTHWKTPPFRGAHPEETFVRTPLKGCYKIS